MIVAFVGNPYPQIYILTNLHNHLFNIYENYPDYTTNEIMSPRTTKIFGYTHKHWPSRINMIPQ